MLKLLLFSIEPETDDFLQQKLKYLFEKGTCMDFSANRRLLNESAACWITLVQELESSGFSIPDFSKTPSGKPFCKGNPVYFSVSHTDGLGAVLICDVPCGIDIEPIRHWNPKSRHRFDCLNACADDSLCTREWTRREAAAKMDDQPLASILKKESLDGYFFSLQWQNAWISGCRKE